MKKPQANPKKSLNNLGKYLNAKSYFRCFTSEIFPPFLVCFLYEIAHTKCIIILIKHIDKQIIINTKSTFELHGLKSLVLIKCFILEILYYSLHFIVSFNIKK